MVLGVEVGLGPGHIVLDGYPGPLSKKGSRVPQFFGPFLLWPNGWMHQDATWYGGRPRPRRHCVRWGPSSPKTGHSSPIFGPCIYCGQTAVCIRIPLGTEVRLSLGDVVLDGDPALPCLKGHSPNFRSMSVVAKLPDGLRCHLVWRWASAQVTLCSMGTQLLQKKGTAPTQSLAHVYCCQTAVCIRIPLGTEVGLSLGDIVLDLSLIHISEPTRPY